VFGRENIMGIELSPIIQKYIEASNRHDLQGVLSCFSDDAVVHDENEMLRGKKAIENWIVKTIEKYKFQFQPIDIKNEETAVVVAIEVSGTFPGSPVTLDYHFEISSDRIEMLAID
jgi:ketosteroid isomerase-like protein